jgi:hypothetical protein
MRDPMMYRDAIEAMGRRGKRVALHNLMNRIASRTRDKELAALMEKVIRDFCYSSSNPEVWSMAERSQCRENATRLVVYCQNKLLLTDGRATSRR